jgi:hypothetical protein
MQTDWDFIAGLDIYTPTQIQQGILEQKAFTDGRDVFFIAKQGLPEDEVKGYAEFSKNWSRAEPLKAGIAKREYFGSEGELVKFLDFWQIIHKDQEMISHAINVVFYKIAEKTLAKSDIKANLPDNINFSRHIWEIPQGKIASVRSAVRNNKLIFKSHFFKEEIDLK